MASAIPALDRSRIGWWLLALALGAALALVVHAFVGTFVLGLFVYYGVRPLDRQVRRVLSPGAAAAVTLVAFALPALILLASIVAVGVGELGTVRSAFDWSILSTAEIPTTDALRDRLGGAASGAGPAGELLSAGAGLLAAAAGGLLHVFVALSLAFYLLRDDERLVGWFRGNVAGEGSPAHAYLAAVDRDLATIYFGNVALIAVVSLLASVVYHGFNLLAPDPLGIPVPTTLALLTGVASLIPIVVGKVVYVPLALALGVAAARTDPSLLVYPVGLFLVCLAVVDLVPMTLLLPRIAGRKAHVGLVLLAYLFGPLLFGWYGLFLGPLLLVLGVQLVRIAFTELLHGERITPTVTAAPSIGADPPVEDGS